MKFLLGNWFLRFIVAAALILPGIKNSPLAQTSTSLTMAGPTSCPAGGCSAGQRIVAHGEFTLKQYTPGNENNVQVCVYAPQNWGAEGFPTDLTGIVSSVPYAQASGACEAAPANYVLLGGLQTAMTSNLWSTDALEFPFRLGRQATNDGSLLMTVLERTNGTWARSQQVSLTIPVEPVAAVVFVANDANACSGNSPCYVNSGGNGDNGIGTGLKDAIDAQTQPVTIQVLGNYTIQAKSVEVNQAHRITGLSNAMITASGADCSSPILAIGRGVTIQNLTITDGNCTSPNRDLLQIQSDEPVTLEGNTLTGGKDAIHILPSSGVVSVRFNDITNNSGYAILRDPADTPGTVEATANNLYMNQLGAQVECSGKGTVDHNYWEGSTAGAVSQCTAAEGKRLGAPIAARANLPGVDAQEVKVTTQKTYAFNSQVAFQRSNDGSDSSIYIVNHGKVVPFTSVDRPIACSNFWDVFQSKTPFTSTTLNLSFRYPEEAACVAAIELSTEYCGSGDNTKSPLWWYDPVSNATQGWDLTGKPLGSGANNAAGQATTCNSSLNEIQVAIDADGRPALSDLSFAPFVVGVRGAAFASITATPANKQVTIKWRTTSEVNLKGFFLLRSNQQDSGYKPITDFITAKGGDMVAANYDFMDTGLTNNTTYYYRLEVVSKDLTSYYTEPLAAVPNIPTATPSFTPPATLTRAPTFTRVPTRIFPTRTPFPTRTVRPATSVARTSTLNPSLRTPTRSVTPTTRFGTPGAIGTQLGTGYPVEPGGLETGYPGEVGTVTETVTPGTPSFEETAIITTYTLTPGAAGPGGEENPPASATGLAVGGLLAGIVLGLAVLGGGGWFLWSRGMLPEFLSFLPPHSGPGSDISGPQAGPPPTNPVS